MSVVNVIAFSELNFQGKGDSEITGDGRNFASKFQDLLPEFHRFLAVAVYQEVTRTSAQASTRFLP